MGIQMEIAERIVEQLPVGSTFDELKTCIVLVLSDYRIEKTQDVSYGDICYHVDSFIAGKRIEGLSPKTLKNYFLYLKKFACALNKDVDQVTTEDIRGYLGNLLMKDSSMQTVVATLRSFFSWLHREEIVRRNPMNRIPSPKKSKRKMRKALTAEELEQLRQATATKRERALVEMFFSTGCRLSEVAHIRLSDIDFRDRSIRVLGKGGKERLVYFSVRAQLLILDYLNNRNSACGDALFCNTRAPHGPMCPRSMQKCIKEIGERAGLAQTAHPHKLRHTMAVLAHNNGMAITVLQKILGHEYLSTTQIYADINMTNVRHEYERYVS